MSRPAPIPINRDARNAKTDVVMKKKPTPNPTSVPPPTAHAPRSKRFSFAVIRFLLLVSSYVRFNGPFTVILASSNTKHR